MIKTTALYKFSKIINKKLTKEQTILLEKLEKLNQDLLKGKVEKERFTLFKKKEQNQTKGMYIYGGVGQGKTMLMDQFYDKVQIPKYRMHFHEFMLDIHNKLHKFKQHDVNHNNSNNNNNNKKGKEKENVMKLMCSELVKKYKVLCLDEFHVTHISDAMVLKELFTNLFEMGLVLICTSNRPPEELYKNGLNRDRFLPFIPILYKYCEIYNLNTNDFRQLMMNSVDVGGELGMGEGVNKVGDNSSPRSQDGVGRVGNESESEKVKGQMTQERERVIYTNKSIESFVNEYVKNNNIEQKEIEETKLQVTPLRSIKIKQSHNKTCFFQFSDLCTTQSSIGTDSFIKIANRFNTIYLTDIPQFDTNLQYNNQLRAFIQLIDILYEKNIKLVYSTNKPLIYLFGSYGLIKLFERFYETFNPEDLKFSSDLNLEDFVKLGEKYKLDSKDCTKLFNSMLLSDQKKLSVERLLNVVNTHKELVEGNYPQKFQLYKLDTSEETSEDEFQCSRALSRLFHMCTSNYLNNHKLLYS